MRFLRNRKTLRLGLLILALGSLLSLSCLPGFESPTTVPTTTTQSISPSTGRNTINEAWNAIFDQYVDKSKLDAQKLSQGAIKGILEALNDPYMAYLDPHSYSMERQGLEGTYGGIGAYVGAKDDRIVIISVLPGSPAERAGLRSGDAIIEVAGQSTSGLSVTDVVLKIRGPSGTSVDLTIQHEGATEPEHALLKRENIQVKSVTWEMKGDIAYLRIIQFLDPTSGEFDSAVSGIIQQQDSGKVRGLILDLRSNPGGLLDTVVNIASHFVSEGTLVYVVDRDGNRSELAAVPNKQQLKLPMVILVDQFSASGSEVLSGALRDRIGAKLVGRKTFGKGSVNTFQPLPDGGALYITHARWLTPNGTLIEGKGLEPDIPSDLQGADMVDWAINYLHQQAPAKSSAELVPAGAQSQGPDRVASALSERQSPTVACAITTLDPYPQPDLPPLR